MGWLWSYKSDIQGADFVPSTKRKIFPTNGAYGGASLPKAGPARMDAGHDYD